jgi:dolichol-phosphate mannosyltransferase
MAEFAVIIPTLNERSNVAPMVHALASVLRDIDFELVFVDDDSTDGTASRVREISRSDPRVRLVHRINRRGLASAAVEGMMATNAPFLAVIDGDMQHDETVLPEMLRLLKGGGVDLVVGTRHRKGGSTGEFSRARLALSQLGRRLSTFVCRADVSDPMSGFFALRRDYLDEVVRDLSCIGFKILVDLLASSRRPVRIVECGYTFRNRLHGESKLDLLVGLDYLELLIDKSIGQWIPVRYALYGLVGALGVVAQLAATQFLLMSGRFQFTTAQLVSSLAAIVLNYAVNNQITFRDRRLHGWRWLAGLAAFSVCCSLGLYLNLRVAGGLIELGVGWAVASLSGILIASVWNYSLSALLVWRVNRRRSRHQPVGEIIGNQEPA